MPEKRQKLHQLTAKYITPQSQGLVKPSTFSFLSKKIAKNPEKAGKIPQKIVF